MNDDETRPAAEIEPLIRFEDVAATYNITVRALKSQVRAHKAARVVLGSRWYFTPAQLAAFREASTVTSGSDCLAEAQEEARTRIASRSRTGRRRAASSWGTR
jgi:hypothetical protein